MDPVHILGIGSAVKKIPLGWSYCVVSDRSFTPLLFLSLLGAVVVVEVLQTPRCSFLSPPCGGRLPLRVWW